MDDPLQKAIANIVITVFFATQTRNREMIGKLLAKEKKNSRSNCFPNRKLQIGDCDGGKAAPTFDEGVGGIFVGRGKEYSFQNKLYQSATQLTNSLREYKK